MVTTILTFLATVLPLVFTAWMEYQTSKRRKANADAKSDVRLLDDVLPPAPPGGVS